MPALTGYRACHKPLAQTIQTVVFVQPVFLFATMPRIVHSLRYFVSTMTSSRKILVTSALPYANGSIHLGHMLEYIQTDIWVRFQKMRGHQCIYVCADDAHGSAIMLRAEQEGITPEQLIEAVHQEHSSDFADFLVNFDNYYSTHSEENRELSELIYEKLKANGHISTRSVTQYFDPEKGMFL